MYFSRSPSFLFLMLYCLLLAIVSTDIKEYNVESVEEEEQQQQQIQFRDDDVAEVMGGSFKLVLFDKGYIIGAKYLYGLPLDGYTGPRPDGPYNYCVIDSTTLLGCIEFQKINYAGAFSLEKEGDDERARDVVVDDTVVNVYDVDDEVVQEEEKLLRKGGSGSDKNLQGCWSIKGVYVGFGCVSMRSYVSYYGPRPLGTQLCIVDSHFVYYCSEVNKTKPKSFPYGVTTRYPFFGGFGGRRRLYDLKERNKMSSPPPTINEEKEEEEEGRNKIVARQQNFAPDINDDAINERINNELIKELMKELKAAGGGRMKKSKNAGGDNKTLFDPSFVGDGFDSEVDGTHPNTPLHLWYICLFIDGTFGGKCASLSSEAPQKTLPKTGFSGMFFVISAEKRAQYFTAVIPTPFGLNMAATNAIEYIKLTLVNFTGVAGLFNISDFIGLIDNNANPNININ